MTSSNNSMVLDLEYHVDSKGKNLINNIRTKNFSRNMNMSGNTQPQQPPEQNMLMFSARSSTSDIKLSHNDSRVGSLK